MRISAEGANRSKKKTIENKEQTARNELEKRNQKISAEGANRSKETREFQQKEQTARKRLETFSRRSKPLEKTREFQQKEQTPSKETREF